MHDAVHPQLVECLDQLNANTSKRQTAEASESPLSHEVVEVASQELQHQNDMTSEFEMAKEAHYPTTCLQTASFLLLLRSNQSPQRPDFLQTLSMVGRIVADDFDGNQLTRFMIEAFEDATKRACSQHFKEFVTEGQVVAKLAKIVSVLIAKVAKSVLDDTFFRSPSAMRKFKKKATGLRPGRDSSIGFSDFARF